MTFHRPVFGCALLVLSSMPWGGLLSAQTIPFAVAEVFNTTPYDGVAVAEVVLPLAKGRTKTVPRLATAAGRVCQVAAMGARWPDGTLRYLRVELPLAVTAYQRRAVELFVYRGATPRFRVHPKLAAAVRSLGLWFHANGQRVEFANPTLDENGHLVLVYRSGLRIKNSTLWAEIRLLVASDQAHARFYFRWGNGNPRTPELAEYPIGVRLEVAGMRLGLEHAKSKVLTRRTSQGGRHNVVLLHHDGRPIGDGQAQCFEGILYTDDPPPRLRAIAHGWAKTMAFGPFGEVFADGPVTAQVFERMLDRDRRSARNDPWAASVHGCYPDPSQTGGQPDFGVIVMREDVVRADPRRLDMIARSVYQEYCRPTHHMEYDLRPVTVANHPKLLIRTGRPHYRAGTWVDRLGKPARFLAPHEYARDPLGRRFMGHDDQHLSINYLCAFALVTGDRIARLECEHHVELWLAEFTLNSGSFNDKVRASRAVGRSLMAGCWLWLVTGRADLRARIEQRAKNVAKSLLAPRTGEPAKLPGVLSPRFKLPGGYFWAPWEEALATIGLMGVSHLFKVPDSLWAASVISSNLVANGIGPTPNGWRVGYFLPFSPDAGYSYSAHFDPHFYLVGAAGSGLTGWSMPGIAIASRYGLHPGIRGLARQMLVDLTSDPVFMNQTQPLDWLGVLPRK